MSTKLFDRFLFPLVFWTWNVLFACLVYFGVVPELFSDLGSAVQGDLPTSFVVCLGVACLVPAASLLAGALKLRKSSTRLIRLFYAVEAPLFVVSLARVFVLRELSGPTAWLLGALFAGTTAHAVLLFVDLEKLSARWRLVLYAGQSVGLAMGTYVAVILAFFAIPVLAFLLDGVVSGSAWHALARAITYGGPLAVLAALVAGYTSTLFVALPFAFFACHLAAFLELFRAYARRGAAVVAWVVPAGALVALVGPTVALRSPTAATLDELETPPASAEVMQDRLQRAGEIHGALVDGYLWRYRYLAAAGQCHGVGRLYRDLLPDGAEPVAEEVQAWFELVVSPFLYPGKLGDEERARAHYAAFFDESIDRGARAEVKHALEATWERVDVPAQLLDVGERAVHLTAQRITVRPDAVGAEIEIFDTYENQTLDDVEILYDFSLPDTAVVTGLWLDDQAPDRATAFAFRISPRGAAQRVYTNEVRRRVDPALLEQIGPRQYRLRVFPIRGRRRLAPGTPPPKMYVWLTYRALPEAGGWPLPRLFEARNVFWDARTVRSVDGRATAGTDAWGEASVRPRGAIGTPRGALSWRAHDRYVVATPVPEAPSLPRGGRRYAVVVDRSYSMNTARDALERELDWLRAEIHPRSDVDLYLTSAPSRGAPPRRLDDAPSYDVTRESFYGGQSTASMLGQAAELAEDADLPCPIGRRGIECYDAVLLLTDRGRREMEDGAPFDWAGRVPLWIVHVDGQLAAGYDDATTEGVEKSGGGVATDLAAVFTTFAMAERHGGAFIGFGGGYAWTLSDRAAGPAPSGFAPLAARQLVRAAVQTQDVSKRDVLDRIHAVAKQEGIVTAYSSMIVLVEERQHRLLDEAENASDRFDREGGEEETRLSTPNDLGLTGTPEPEEWALMLVAVVLLAWFGRDRLKLQRTPPIVGG